MDPDSPNSMSSARVLVLAESAYRSVNQLNEILQYWSSAPSEARRLRDTTARLHNLLTSFGRAQDDDDAFSLTIKRVTETLACNIDVATGALNQLSRILDFVSKPDVLDILKQTKSTVRIKSRWSMRRDTISVVQLQLDESCQRLLARLKESNVYDHCATFVNRPCGC